MPRPILYSATDIEQLGMQLAENLRKNPPSDPFKQDIILVDGKATSNWLTQAIVGAGGLKVHMNAQLMNTRRFGNWAAGILADTPGNAGNPMDALPARLYRLLGEEPHRTSWKKWSGVTESDDDAKRAEAEVVRWGLAFRLNRHFQDLIRNDEKWITRAEKGADDRWSVLWRAAIGEIRALSSHRHVHDVDVLKALTVDLNAAENRRKLAARLPGRLTLFVTGDTSATLLRMLMALSEDLTVTFYQFQPTEGLNDRTTMSTTLSSLGTDEEDVDAANPALPLLISAGRYYRLQFEKFQDLLDHSLPTPLRAPKTQATRLDELKRALRTIATGEEFTPKALTEAEENPSISIHRCHGPLREVEILRDQLLATLQQNPDIRQGDILVLSPTPEIYAPLLRSVLGSRYPRFSVGTANLYGAGNSSFGSLVKALVELPGGRITAGDVHTLLSMRAMQDRLKWGADDLETIQSWMEEAPFYWGFDKAHRQEYYVDVPTPDESKAKKKKEDAEFKQPPEPTDIGTLKDFRKRLALGTALGHRVIVAAETSPMPGIAGREGLDLAKDLGDVLEPLIGWVGSARQAMSLSSWVEAFRKVAVLLPSGKDYVRQNKELGQALERLKAQSEAMSQASEGATDQVSHSLFCQMLLDQCDFEAGSGQFMSGRVTLAPLRATSVHPTKVIAFVGMSDGAFPLKSRGVGPEIAQEKKAKKGDKKPKSSLAALGASCQEDTSMHAFLLALLAAQRRVIATFDGYAGSTGKKASSALPLEILRRVVGKLGPGFALNYHSLADYQAPRTSDDLKKEKPVRQTFDEHACNVFEALKTDPEKIAPCIEPKTGGQLSQLSHQEWAELWTKPTQTALSQLGIKSPRKKYNLDGDEPLEANTSVAYAANDWIDRWRDDVPAGQPRRRIPKEAGEIETIAKAISDLREKSGFFPPGGDGTRLLAQLLAMQSILEEEETQMKRPLRDALGSTKPVESHQIKAIKLPKATAYENAEYESPHSNTKGVLVLTVDQEPDWDDCLTGLAMLCKYDQEGTRYRKVTVLGLKKRNTTTKVATLLDLASRELEVTDKGVEQLRHGFEKLAASPLSAQRPLLMKLLLESFKKHFPEEGKPKKKDLDLKLEDILPTKHAKPKHEERIVMPERYDLEDFNRIAQAMFAGNGDIRKTTKTETTAEQATSEEAK
jgi:exonuclease V gamma subunit